MLPPSLRPLLPAVGSLALLASGCPTTTSPDEVSYVRDVKPILDARCVHCHQDGQVGPMPLDTFERAAAFSDQIAQVTADRSMPPFLADPECHTYNFDPTLSDEQIGVLQAWADEGAPEGEMAPGDQPMVGIEPLDLEAFAFEPDLTMTLPEVYTPSLTFGQDDYRCFVMEWPEEEGKWVTGFTTRPDNTRLVHHVIAYLIPPNRVDRVYELDDAEPGPGYTCFGGPGVGGNEWLGAWAPGGAGGKYPEGTGLWVEPGSVVALQVHYHLENGTGPDQTAIEVKLSDSVEKPATIEPFLNPAWTVGDNMLIPAGESDVSHTFTYEVGSDDETEPFLVHAANMHMHELGRAGSLWIDRADGTRECILDIADWDFEWQLNYAFQEPVVVEPGDAIGLECRWDNSAEAHASHDHTHGDRGNEPVDVVWGDGTGDEMCLAVVYLSQQ